MCSCLAPGHGCCLGTRDTGVGAHTRGDSGDTGVALMLLSPPLPPPQGTSAEEGTTRRSRECNRVPPIVSSVPVTVTVTVRQPDGVGAPGAVCPCAVCPALLSPSLCPHG